MMMMMIFRITWIEASSIHPPSIPLLRGPQFHGMLLDPPRMPRKSWSGHLVYGQHARWSILLLGKTVPKENRRQSQVWLGYLFFLGWEMIGICYGFVRTMAAIDANRMRRVAFEFKVLEMLSFKVMEDQRSQSGKNSKHQCKSSAKV